MNNENFHRSMVSGASFDEKHESNSEMKKVHSAIKAKHRSMAKHAKHEALKKKMKL